MTSTGATTATKSPFSQHFKASLAYSTPLEKIKFGGVEMPENLIYLDNAAATPMDDRVLSKMLPWMTRVFGNPANRLHAMGEFAEHGLSWARQTIAETLGVGFDDVVFCASATEANNLLLRGLVANPLRKRNKIVVAATEHSSILTTAQELAELGLELSILNVDTHGQIDLDTAAQEIDENTLCVCVMDVNNETGVIQKHLNEIAALAHQKGAVLHVDAVQGLARSNFHSSSCNFDTATISGAKIYAGRGAAALIIRKRTPRIRIVPQLTGGGHEGGLRSGTPNLASIIGFAEAVRLQREEHKERLHHLAHIESVFLSHMQGLIDVQIAGSQKDRVPGILMLTLTGVNAMKLIENMKRICVSSGSACRTLQATTSHVLRAMGFEEDVALSSFRVSLGLTNSETEMAMAAQMIAHTAIELRASSANL